MKSLWSDSDASSYVARYGAKGVSPDLALRVYTTRLLGGDRALVLHGGGNTSVKTRASDVTGEQMDVICVKGSGWDMGDIEPAGLPAVKLAPLRRLLKLPKLSDEDMVNYQRIHLLDSSAPNPSVETLLHAFLPHKYVDHTHSTAVLALTDLLERRSDAASLRATSKALGRAASSWGQTAKGDSSEELPALAATALVSAYTKAPTEARSALRLALRTVGYAKIADLIAKARAEARGESRTALETLERDLH